MEDRKIEIYPSSVLLLRARSASRADSKIAELLRQNIPAYAVGLAAPQIGIRKRVIAWRNEEELEIVWNPACRGSGEKVWGLESCLSLPGETFAVPRWPEITFSGRDENWKPFSITLSNWPARVIQHEIDHLDGILICDRGEPYQENTGDSEKRE